MANPPTLQLVCESKIRDLLPNDAPNGPLEASGILAREGKYFIVFDNRTAVARLSDNLLASDMNGMFGMARVDQGYEGIAYNSHKRRFYLLIEARNRGRGKFNGEIFEYDDTLSYIKHRPLDFEFKSSNKGFEALAHVRRDGRDYALALCEGNKCKGGGKGRAPGGGRVQLFEKGKQRWSHVRTIKLPKSVQFKDYSAMAIDDHRVAIVSQENSMLWIGVFEEATWSWRDDGDLYEFPRTADGEVLYGNVEGVAWITRDRIVTVSDRRKSDQPDRCADKDQSIHIFDVPE